MALETRQLFRKVTRAAHKNTIPVWVKVSTIAAQAAAVTLAVGHPMAFNTATNFWTPWVTAGANGTGTISAFLMEERTVGVADDVQAQLMLAGKIDYSSIVISGGTEAQLKTALRTGPRDLGLFVIGLDQVS